PREAECEYACRAGTVIAWSHGSDEALLRHYAWFTENARTTMHPVAMLKPNGFGLFDMHGNAWQWCQEIYGEKDNKDKVNANNKDSRILRGGSFFLDSWPARSAFRLGTQGVLDETSYGGGFRVAR